MIGCFPAAAEGTPKAAACCPFVMLNAIDE
jgi:hypothetical protein